MQRRRKRSLSAPYAEAEVAAMQCNAIYARVFSPLLSSIIHDNTL
jgi:hypothetical protein